MRETLNQITQDFNSRGWRMTTGVKGILKILKDARHLFSVHEIKNKMLFTGNNLDSSTIYRILEKLEQLKVIHEFDGRWKMCANQENKDEHHFLICEKCGQADELFLDYKNSISDQLAKEKNFLLKHVHLGFYGTCANCHRKK
ncbi:transcriptional repressor [Candidatus Gracilibacteria bacterium]|nr:transcriptional repressor [Candidatus Gracilibacteria bacterium]